MYANVVAMRYKSEKDLEQAVQKLLPLSDQLPGVPGFVGFTLLRTSPLEAMAVSTFESREAADAARAKVLPKVREAAAPHLTGEITPVVAEVLSKK